MPVKRFNEHLLVLRKLGVSAICDKTGEGDAQGHTKYFCSSNTAVDSRSPWQVWDHHGICESKLFLVTGEFSKWDFVEDSITVFKPLPEFTLIPPSPLGNCNLNFLPRIAFTSIMWKSWIGSEASLAAHTCEERLFCAYFCWSLSCLEPVG